MTAGATETKKFLEDVYGKQIPDTELVDYKNKLVQLFALLIEADRKQTEKETIASK